MTVKLAASAKYDLMVGADFYEAQKVGLGEDFVECLLTDCDSLLVTHGVHERQGGFYRSRSKRFPFAIFYDVSDETIVVYGIMDYRQNPDTIAGRLAGLR